MQKVLAYALLMILHDLNLRTIRRKVIMQSKHRRPSCPGNPRRLQQQRASVMHRAAYSHDTRRAQRGDGQDLLQPGD